MYIQKKITSICLFIDFEKAFDSVWKKGLIVKLNNIGIQGKILHLINDFLMNRKVTLNINGVVGKIGNGDEVGLPQGSAFSPVLFRIYVIDLVSNLSNKAEVSSYKFADDGSIKVTGITTTLCLESFNNCLNEIYLWTRKWRMIINCQQNKTEVVCFGRAENDPTEIPNTFKLGNEEIHRVHHTKVLGLIIDENLNFEEHSKKVYQKLLELWVNVCQYSNRNWGFNHRTMIQILKTLILPTLLLPVISGLARKT